MCPIDAIRASARPMAVFSGFFESPGPPPAGDVGGIVPPHCNAIKMAIKVGTSYIVVLFDVALAAAEAIWSK